ncbi:MAG: MATE family efflux transporter [Clostridiales bacterium]|nr:MATE family efflux transporter [Clostridiales bacterium]
MQGVARLRRALIGNRAFYRTVLAIVVPVIIQNTVTNAVNLLDNIMVGRVGTAEMSGVAVANQLLFVFNLCIFGGLSGPGIFGAQFYGAGDLSGLRNTFRIKLWISAVLLAGAAAAFTGWGDQLIRRYLTGDGDAGRAAAIFQSARDYLAIMLAGTLPFALVQCYSGTLRETGKTALPMIAGIAAVLTNLCGNWILIYGHLGFPALGVRGAAIATVISRYVELAIVVIGVHSRPQFSFLRGVYRTLAVPMPLVRSVLQKGIPLLSNEALWALGVATQLQIYSVRGMLVLAGINIASTITNLFNVVFLSMGNAVAVIVGQALGANDLKRAREDVWKLLFFSSSSCLFIGAALAAISPLFIRLYAAEAAVYPLAARFILAGACVMPFSAISHSCYFTLRSGGSTLVTFVFDCVFSWGIVIPFAYLLVYKTGLDIMILVPAVQSTELLKCMLGLLLVKKGVWIRNIVSAPAPAIAAEEAS